jgi:hypothetical protein
MILVFAGFLSPPGIALSLARANAKHHIEYFG